MRLPLCFLFCGILLWFLWDAAAIRSAVTEALLLCAGTVIPAMFPFLVISNLLITLGLGDVLSPAFAGVMSRLFRLPGSAGSALLLGLTGGYPIGAKTAADLYRSGLLTREETQRLLTFCNNANPAFFLSVLGAGVFQSVRVGLYLWLIHLQSALLSGWLLCRKRTGSTRIQRPPIRNANSDPISVLWVSAVGSALQGILSICAFVMIFYVLTRPLASLPGLFGAAATGILELFSLIPLLSNDSVSLILVSALSGWGGLSVLCQTASMLAGTDLSISSCIKGKLLQCLFSAFFAVLLILFRIV
jgi:sporulation integral membrane protein YlbJ